MVTAVKVDAEIATRGCKCGHGRGGIPCFNCFMSCSNCQGANNRGYSTGTELPANNSASGSDILVGNRQGKTSQRIKVGSPVSDNSAERKTYYQLERVVRNFIRKGSPIVASLFNEVLFQGNLVNEEHLTMMKEWVANSTTGPMPVPGTPASAAFTIGGTHRKPAEEKRVPGCYHIQSSAGSYVGQAVHLGTRIREHGASKTNTSVWLTKQVAGTAIMTVYPMPVMNDYAGLSKTEMLCVFELYLFMILQPTKNPHYLPVAGFMHTEESIKAMSDKAGTPVYVHGLTGNGEYVLLYKATGGRSLSDTLGKSAHYVANLMNRSGGWYRGQLLFSTECLTNNEPTLNAEEMRVRFEEVRKSVTARWNKPEGWNPNPHVPDGYSVVVTDHHTGEETKYHSLNALTRDRGTQKGTVKKYAASGKLLNGRYSFKVSSTLTPRRDDE